MKVPCCKAQATGIAQLEFLLQTMKSARTSVDTVQAKRAKTATSIRSMTFSQARHPRAGSSIEIQMDGKKRYPGITTKGLRLS